MQYLVISATKEEAAHVPDGFDVVVTGIGKTPAAVTTTQAILERDRRMLAVVNIGTAGALRDGVEGLCLPSTVINHDVNGDAIRALGHDPFDELAIDGGDGTVLASGDVFVTDAAVRTRLAARADVVDMEGYGVVFACRRFGIPVRLVKHVSDTADDSAFDWPAVVAASARELGDWLAANLP